jgi:hypothetical protein
MATIIEAGNADYTNDTAIMQLACEIRYDK